MSFIENAVPLAEVADTPAPTTVAGLSGARNWFAKVKEVVR